MIRDKNKIYGEPNDVNTVSAPITLTENHYIMGAGNKTIRPYSPGPNTILIITKEGLITSLSFNGLPNRVIATDSYGNISLIDRSSI